MNRSGPAVREAVHIDRRIQLGHSLRGDCTGTRRAGHHSPARRRVPGVPDPPRRGRPRRQRGRVGRCWSRPAPAHSGLGS